MTLPGKRKVKVKRPKPKESESTKETTPEEEQTKEASTMTGGENIGDETLSQSAAAAGPVTPSLDDNVYSEEERVKGRAMPVDPDFYASDDGESVVSGDGGPRSRTSSVTEGRSWMCFHRGTNVSKPAPVSSTSSTRSLKDTVEEDATQATQSSLSLAADGEASNDSVSSSQKIPAHTEPVSPDVGHDDDEEEEEFIEVEKDMVLRLGNGGRIGVLDVRLVGKELHVSIEDAFLVVEACQPPDKPTDDTDAASTAGSEKDDGPKGKEPAADKSKKANTRKDMSDGERVLDKSAIARALSAIPHLFLRDCHVRLVVREGDVGHEAEADISEEDSVLDLGIELLSVTSGEDFLAHVRADEDATSSNFDEEAYRSQTSFASYDESSNNEFIVKRIRTGRGPEGGIWLKIFPPGKNRKEKARLKVDEDKDVGPQWARERWTSNTEFCIFRCSGLDVRSRIFVGKQEETMDEYFFYDEFAVDSMLVGVDYVAPGPAPALPPLGQSATASALEAMQSMGVSCYDTDNNGIQSVKLDSAFHKIARGLAPTACKGDHLPCETCSKCWTQNGKADTIMDHPLDASTPLAGLVLNLSLNDPLEINVDRSSLEVIGQLAGLFIKKTAAASPEISDEEAEEDADVGSSIHGGRICMPAARRSSAKKADITDSFPTYMQPENIEILGLHLATIVIRIHAMRNDGSYDGGLSFCYWETQTRCITMDIQKLSSEKSAQDVRIDVAEFSAVEYKGVKHHQFVTLGLPHQPDVSSSDSNSTPLKKTASYSCSRASWPSTAYALLGIPAPLETNHYESRERHGIQMRYISVSSDGTDEERSSIHLRIGVTSVEMPWKAKNDVYNVISESKKSLFGSLSVDSEQETRDEPAAKPVSKKDPAESTSSLMKCKIGFDGGRVNIRPVMNLCLPPSTFFAEKSSSYGLFFETMLQRLEFAYGERSIVPKPRRGGISLFASLPEGVRLRVLLFVNDLGPLETALGLKHEKNALLRFKAVNTRIVKVAKQSSKSRRKKGKARMSSSQREEVLAELLSMDDMALQELWALHRSNAQKPKGHTRKASI